MLPEEDVPDELWEYRPVERKPGGEKFNGFPNDPAVTGKYVSRAVIAGYVDSIRQREFKSYDPVLGNLPTITRWATARLHDARHDTTVEPVQDRYIDLAEYC